MSVELGEIIDGKYEIVSLLGEGGMGAVYEGRNALISRRVAIKVLHASMTGAQDIVLRFEREAQAAGKIGSDHILEVLDLGTLPSGDRYMVLEFLDGETVAERIVRKGRLNPSELAPLLKQALIGLSAAHGAGIIHRDLKPDNLFILKEKAGRTDFVKIIDFGISKFGALTGDMSMTSTGAVMGTPYYMSPEQAKGAGGVSHQSDIYSMGVIAFEALTGKVPFEGTTFNDLMFKIVLSDLPSLSEACPGIDAKFAKIVEKALAKDLDVRYQTADEFYQALEAWTPGAETIASGTAAAALSEDRAGSSTKSAGSGAGAGPGGTDTAWANTGTDEANSPSIVPVKKTPVAMIALGAVGLLVVVGGGLAMSGGDPEAKDADSEVAEEQSAVQPAPEPEITPEAAVAAPEPEEPKQEDPAPEPQKVEKPAPAPAAQPAPVAKPPAPAPAAPRPKPTPKPKPRDFGY